MYRITTKGKEYLDRMLGAGYKIGTESERKQRVLSYLEFANGGNYEDIKNHITRQRRLKEEGWAPKGNEQDYIRTINKLLQEGYIKREA